MKQTIEIEVEVPDGKKAFWKDNKVVFEDINPQLPKTWEEFCKLCNIRQGEAYIDEFSHVKIYDVLCNRAITDCNVLPSVASAKQHLALMQLHQLRDCYRQGWEPNCGENTAKYCIVGHISTTNKKKMLKIEIFYNINTFLSFQKEVIAQEFLNNFRDLIEQAGDLLQT